jgi:hypothetical protein
MQAEDGLKEENNICRVTSLPRNRAHAHASRDDLAKPCACAIYPHAMAPLKNQKHEIFCRKIIEAAQNAQTQGWAYRQAGYDCENGASEAAASRLLRNVTITDRIAELGAPAVKRTRVSVESLLVELQTTIDDARASKQHSVVVNALTLSAKLVGLLRERVEIGAAGAFGECTDLPQLVEALLVDTTPAEALETLDALREQLELHALMHANVVIAAPDRTRVDEGAASLAAFRKPRRNGRGR